MDAEHARHLGGLHGLALYLPNAPPVTVSFGVAGSNHLLARVGRDVGDIAKVVWGLAFLGCDGSRLQEPVLDFPEPRKMLNIDLLLGKLVYRENRYADLELAELQHLVLEVEALRVLDAFDHNCAIVEMVLAAEKCLQIGFGGTCYKAITSGKTFAFVAHG